MSQIHLLDQVKLLVDLPDVSLESGTIGKVVRIIGQDKYEISCGDELDPILAIVSYAQVEKILDAFNDMIGKYLVPEDPEQI